MRPPWFLFVCLGNICRSPLAEAAFVAAAERAGIAVEADSAGTGGWHASHAPDPRSQAVAARHGIDISGMRARQIRAEDFRRFDHILALDPQNLLNLQAIAPGDATARISRLMDHVPGRTGQGVRDPYYGGRADFDEVWRDVNAAADALVAMLVREGGQPIG
jgi:protein-tyrosine phosphatase